MRIFDSALLAGLILLGGCAAGQMLSEPEIRGMLADHTAFLPGGFVEYYALDGKVRGMSDGQPYDGKWEIKGDGFCTALSGDPAICTHVIRKGDAILWSPDGDKKPSRIQKIVPGNPKGL